MPVELNSELTRLGIARVADLSSAPVTALIFADTTAGIAGTASGQYFSVPSTDSLEYLVLYKNNAGAAQEVKRYPSVSAVDTSKTVASGKNLFDPASVTAGYEVYQDGTLKTQADSSVSGLIYVNGQSYITISGLQVNTESGRVGRLLAEDGTTVIQSNLLIPSAATGSTFPVPSGAYWFQFSPKQRNPAAANYSSVQVEYGIASTQYESFGVNEALYLGSKRLHRPIKTISVGGQKNKFNGKTLNGFEVYADGSIRAEANSAVSDFILVDGQKYIAVSGLQANLSSGRYYVFYASDKSTAVGTGVFSGNSANIKVPDGAKWFRFSPKQRNTDSANYTTAQVEYGGVITPHAPYEPAMVELNGMHVGRRYESFAAWRGARLLTFGDSITETATVLADGTYTEGVRSNWPKFVLPMIEAGSLKNYAESGASYREYGGQTDWQKISYQITKAQEHALAADIIVVSAGTNDGLVSLGSYATAMGKATLADLDRSNTIEAMRWSFWTIQSNWPNAKCFAVLPIQRADIETADRQALFDAIAQMAKRYGFIVVDAHSDSGIVKDFEVNGSAGRDLYDGLHPSESGQIKIAKLIASKIKSSMA